MDSEKDVGECRITNTSHHFESNYTELKLTVTDNQVYKQIGRISDRCTFRPGVICLCKRQLHGLFLNIRMVL